MVRWLGYERFIEIGAELTLHPKPPWWHPFRLRQWREECAHIGIITLYRQELDKEE